MKPIVLILTAVSLTFALTGCERLSDRLGLEDPAKKTARQDAEGKAVGGGCRQSGRAIEDCYAIYTWLPMESVYAGWREMDEYMRENNLETVTPLLPPAPDPTKKKKKKSASSAEDTADAGEESTPSPAPVPGATSATAEPVVVPTVVPAVTPAPATNSAASPAP